jgi:hypothetical protein
MNWFEQAKQAIDRMFGDTSAGLQDTLESLEELRAYIDMDIDAVRADIKRRA